MYRVSYNIGTVKGLINLYPNFVEFETIRDFTEYVRNSVLYFVDKGLSVYPNQRYYRKLILFVYIASFDDSGLERSENLFEIKLINVREYLDFCTLYESTDDCELSIIVESGIRQSERDYKLSELGI